MLDALEKALEFEDELELVVEFDEPGVRLLLAAAATGAAISGFTGS